MVLPFEVFSRESDLTTSVVRLCVGAYIRDQNPLIINKSSLISRSSVAHQLLISCSSVAHQLLISYSSVAHQSLISHSSVAHQSLISRSSVAHQLLISCSSVAHQSLRSRLLSVSRLFSKKLILLLGSCSARWFEASVKEASTPATSFGPKFHSKK